MRITTGCSGRSAARPAANRHVIDHVFETPTWLLEDDLLRRIEHAGAVDRIRSRQVGILNNLLLPARLQRLIEAEVVDEVEAYPLMTFMNDLKAGVWSELDDARPGIDTYRRNLQRGYLERMDYLMTEEPDSRLAFFYGSVDVSQSDIRPFVRGQLKDLRDASRRAARRTQDAATRYHLNDIADRIDAMLDTGS